jgi:hypothetical protein
LIISGHLSFPHSLRDPLHMEHSPAPLAALLASAILSKKEVSAMLASASAMAWR